jgi:hypothetical protein
MITSTLQVLVCESSTRELARLLKETTQLRNCVDQQTNMSIDAGMARILLDAIDSSSPTIEESSKSSNDISEILESVSALQRILQVNPMFSEYSSGMASTGLSFLLRYTSSAGRIFAGEENAYEERDGRLRSPPIQVNKLNDFEASTDNQKLKNQHLQPPVQPRLPRTPPKSGNPRFISHGKTVEVNDQDKAVQETQHTAKGKIGRRSKPEENEDEEEEEEEEEPREEEEEEEDGDDSEEKVSANPRSPQVKTKTKVIEKDEEEEQDEEEEDD